jgi:UDP-3-O-[3-hydroxymyristoyl] glucosamine N-acyltransferase
MHKTVSEIINELSEWNLFISQQGPDNVITAMPDIKKCGEGDLVFVESEDYVSDVQKNKPSAVVTNEKLAGQFSNLANTSLLVSSNAKLVQALLRQAHVDRDFRDNGWPQIHDSAVVHKSANIQTNVSIGPNVVISKEASIGANSTIMANTVIEEGAQIGNDSIIHPNVTIGYNCKVGDRCIIQSGTVIGSEGFGFAQDKLQKSYRVPQTGNVILGDDVVMGANCTIDRATFNSTHIKDGCKFDNLVHVAHNTTIGEDGLIAAQCGIAGSTNIGKRIRCSGQTGIIDHLEISDDCVFVQRAAALSDVKKPGIYAGNPLLPMRQWFKNAAILKQLEELKKTVSRLDKLAKK